MSSLTRGPIVAFMIAVFYTFIYIQFMVNQHCQCHKCRKCNFLCRQMMLQHRVADLSLCDYHRLYIVKLYIQSMAATHSRQFRKRQLLLEREKFDSEGCHLQERWKLELEISFTEILNNCVCLICQEIVVVYKEFNVKRHMTSYLVATAWKKVKQLEAALASQQCFFPHEPVSQMKMPQR